MARLWLLIALLAIGAAFAAPTLPDFAPVQRPSLLAIAVLALFLWTRSRVKRRPEPVRNILIDGSNVMHWNKGKPDLSVVQKLVQALTQHGYRPGVIFDANVGYKLFDRYMDDAPMAQKLGLPADQVLVSPKGEPADLFLLKAARDMDAPIVTNDRFRDWVEAFPELSQPGRLIRGGMRKGVPYLKT